MSFQLTLIIIIAVIASLTAIKDFTSYKKLDKVTLWGITRKRLLMHSIFALLFIGAVLQIFVLYFQKQNDVEKSNNEIEKYKTILKGFDSSLKKADKTLTKVDIITDSLNQVRKSSYEQLALQKRINSDERLLVNQNERLSSKQNATYNNISRVLNPLFPLNISITVEIPFNNEKVRVFKNFVTALKVAFDKENSPTVSTSVSNISYFKINNVIQIRNADKLLDSLLQGYTYSDISEYEISILMPNRKKVDSINVSTPRINFIIGSSDNKYSHLDSYINVVFSSQTFYVHFEYEGLQFKNNAIETSNEVLGFTDLINSLFVINASDCDINFKIDKISLSSSYGLQKAFEFSLNSNEKFINPNQKDCKAYFHKIIKNDLLEVKYKNRQYRAQ